MISDLVKKNKVVELLRLYRQNNRKDFLSVLKQKANNKEIDADIIKEVLNLIKNKTSEDEYFEVVSGEPLTASDNSQFISKFYNELTIIKEQLDEVKKKDWSYEIDNEKLRGQPGYTPKKGEDYFTEEEIINFLKSITPVKGKDYFDGRDVNEEEVIIKLLTRIQKVEFKNLTGEDIVNKINDLPIEPDKQIDYKHIKNGPRHSGYNSPYLLGGGGRTATTTTTSGGKSLSTDNVVALQEGDDAVIDLDTLNHQYSDILAVQHNGLVLQNSDWVKLSDIIRLYNTQDLDRYSIVYLYNTAGISQEELAGIQVGANVTLDLTNLDYTVDSIIKLTRNGKGLVPTTEYIQSGNYIDVFDADASDAFSILYKYTFNGLDIAAELLIGTQVGAIRTLNLTQLSHPYKTLLFIDRNGKTLASTDFTKVGDIVTIPGSDVTDNFMVQYNY